MLYHSSITPRQKDVTYSVSLFNYRPKQEKTTMHSQTGSATTLLSILQQEEGKFSYCLVTSPANGYVTAHPMRNIHSNNYFPPMNLHFFLADNFLVPLFFLINHSILYNPLEFLCLPDDKLFNQAN